MTARITGLAAVAALLLTAGCGGKVPATRYYLIETAPPAADPGPDGGPAATATGIAVPPVQVAPPYDRDQIVYRLGDDDPRARFYPYDRWAVPLDLMLSDLIAGVVDGAGGRSFRPVSSAGAAGTRLSGRLQRLEEVDRQGVPHVRFALDLELQDGQALNGRWRLESDVPVAAGAAMDDVVRRLRDEMVAALQRLRPALAAALEAAAPAP